MAVEFSRSSAWNLTKAGSRNCGFVAATSRVRRRRQRHRARVADGAFANGAVEKNDPSARDQLQDGNHAPGTRGALAVGGVGRKDARGKRPQSARILALDDLG